MRSRALMCLVVLLFAAAAAHAQAPVLTGLVTTHDDGLALPGATVEVPAL